MRILGIDPGTVVMGYGVIESDGDEISLLDCGALMTKERSPIGERLCYLHEELIKVIRRNQPDEVAVEQPFVAKNVRSAMAVGRAQAIAILAAASNGIPVYEYTPAQVKQRVANFGASTKEQIQAMVKLQLGLDEAPQPADAADALAIAICHLHEMHLKDLLTRSE
ncbi:MAG: crossover junction endodeoxyribonuclease RuvC [Chloroflexi bacterium]|nr:crossover junction endodeoxyribonuclease RuvC [Chloroflexota bacterium]